MNLSHRSIIIAILLLFASHQLTAQDLMDKLARQLCKCVEKQQVKSLPEMEACFEDLLINNYNDLKKYYKAETLDDIDLEDFGITIGAKVIKDCPYIIESLASEGSKYEVTQTKASNLNCDDLRKGEFYYLTERPETTVKDTTFVTITDTMFLERMNQGRTYSLLTIEWKEDCKFDLTYKESNDPFKKGFSSKGDVYKYDILTNGANSVFIRAFWMGQSMQFELFKL